MVAFRATQWGYLDDYMLTHSSILCDRLYLAHHNNISRLIHYYFLNFVCELAIMDSSLYSTLATSLLFNIPLYTLIILYSLTLLLLHPILLYVFASLSLPKPQPLSQKMCTSGLFLLLLLQSSPSVSGQCQKDRMWHPFEFQCCVSCFLSVAVSWEFVLWRQNR